MSTVAEFWGKNKKGIGEALGGGIDQLSGVLQTGAENFNLVQKVLGETIQWETSQGSPQILFCRVPDPRDLNRILEIFELAKENQPVLVAVLVHQWTDGEGNWDAFAITPRLVLVHADRIWGSRDRVEVGSPVLREDIYTLFDSEREFPPPGNREWAKLLDGPSERVF
jgi:hypothetical protein